MTDARTEAAITTEIIKRTGCGYCNNTHCLTRIWLHSAHRAQLDYLTSQNTTVKCE